MYCHLDERGAILPAALILLIMITLMLGSFVVYFDAVYRTYDSLESHYLREMEFHLIDADLGDSQY